MNVENINIFFKNAQNIGVFLIAIISCIVWITGKSVDKSREKQMKIEKGVAENLSILAVDLDNSISQFSIVFEFSKEVNILDMVTEQSYIEIISPSKGGVNKSILISVGGKTKKKLLSDNIPRIPFEIRSDIDKSVLKFQNIQSINMNEFQIALLPQFLDNPFTSIRDFNDCRVSPLLSELMLKNLSKITLAVNGWPILECDIKNAYWRKENTNILGVSISQNKPWSTDFQQDIIPYGLWKINLSRDLSKIAKSAFIRSNKM